MRQLESFDTTFVEISGTKIELATKGQGRPILFLQPGQGLLGAGPALDKLATLGRVIVPCHPGFYGSPLPHVLSTVDDLSYFYLDLLKALDLSGVTLIGASFGGWIAAQIAIKSTQRLDRLVLVDSLGIKPGARDARDITDMHSVDEQELNRLLYHDPARFGTDYTALAEEDIVTITRNNEAWALFGWRPYMHDPKLLGRLYRIDIPTLVLWGEEDRIVSTDYGRHFAAKIPGAEFATIAASGHLPYIEQPEDFAGRIGRFLQS